MPNVEVTKNAKKKAIKYQVKKKFDKQIKFLEDDTSHNSLHYKQLQSVPGVWRFRINKHFWGLVYKEEPDELKCYDVIKHPK